MLIAGVQAGELDEKLCPVAGDVSQHLRLLAARSTALAPDAAGGATYAEIAGTVDRVLGASGPPAVRMPKLASMSLAPDGPSAEDGDFRVQIVVPPGGITFIAAPAIVDGCDGDGDDDTQTAAMSAPVHADEDASDKAAGGFAHPL
ncbi:hypothetical protein IWQ57_006495, partial [Coemansia nantahalensis]